MAVLAVVFSSLVCMGFGRHIPIDILQRPTSVERKAKAATLRGHCRYHRLKSIARLLLASEPRLAFIPPSLGVQPSSGCCTPVHSLDFLGSSLGASGEYVIREKNCCAKTAVEVVSDNGLGKPGKLKTNIDFEILLTLLNSCRASERIADKASLVTSAQKQHQPFWRSRAAVVQMTQQDLPPPEECRIYELYPQRWVQLAYLAMFALISDWVCFSVAAEPETFQEIFSHDPSTVVDIFFITNVLFCFLEPAIVRRLGLRNTVVGSGALMAIGCLLRSGLPFSSTLPSYEQIVAGTILVGAAQPSFQCTPPLLSGTWFASDERALATAIAINFNQVGIATAFMVGGSMMGDAEGLSKYFSVITSVSFLVACGALFQFQERPLTPPTSSAAARLAESANPDAPPPQDFLTTARGLLKTPGFTQALVAFVGSIAVSNIVSTFTEITLHDAGVFDQNTIDIAGASFQAAIVLGGIFLGGYVDRTREYKQVTLACILGAFFLLLPLGLAGTSPPLVIAALISLGALVGPVQPINAELAVEVAYPADENAIEALQQLCGNLFTALLVPMAEKAARVHLDVANTGSNVRGDTLLLGSITLGALAYFNTFNARLERTAIDCADPDGLGLEETSNF